MKEDPNNYRGISVMSNIGKLFFTILNNRLTKFTIEKNLLLGSQLGFIQRNRTSDPHNSTQPNTKILSKEKGEIIWMLC